MTTKPEVREADLEHIASQIVKGFTSGEICPCNDNGESTGRGWWSINTEVWAN